MCNIAVENQYQNGVFVIHKTYSSFLNYFCSVSVAFALKESSSKRRTVVLLKESVQISPCDFVCEREAS